MPETSEPTDEPIEIDLRADFLDMRAETASRLVAEVGNALSSVYDDLDEEGQLVMVEMLEDVLDAERQAVGRQFLSSLTTDSHLHWEHEQRRIFLGLLQTMGSDNQIFLRILGVSILLPPETKEFRINPEDIPPELRGRGDVDPNDPADQAHIFGCDAFRLWLGNIYRDSAGEMLLQDYQYIMATLNNETQRLGRLKRPTKRLIIFAKMQPDERLDSKKIPEYVKTSIKHRRGSTLETSFARSFLEEAGRSLLGPAASATPAAEPGAEP